MTESQPLVGIIMGSDSDWPVMEAAATVLAEFDVPYEADVVSAHRMPKEMVAYAESAAERGLRARQAPAQSREAARRGLRLLEVGLGEREFLEIDLLKIRLDPRIDVEGGGGA